MRVKALKNGSGGIYAGGIYTVLEQIGDVIRIDEFISYNMTHPNFKVYFEVMVEEPEPQILTGKVDTRDEINERLGASGRDPLYLAVSEIMDIQEAHHAVIKSTAQLVEINKMLLPMIDEVSKDISEGKSCGTLNKIRIIRQFVEAGSRR
jgi:hypothetical protein